VAWGYQESSGILKISLASAYDLDLNLDEATLEFELKNPGVEASEVRLVKLVANETEFDGSLFTTWVESMEEATGLKPAIAGSTFNIYRFNDRVVADANLETAQSRLVLTVYDMSGRMTNQLVLENQEAGPHHYTFSAQADGGTDQGQLYLVTVTGDDFTLTRKIVLK
jgi:hypothetical protein